VDKVWHVWNDPELMKQWWSPKGYTAPVIKNDLRVGGTFFLSMKSPKGETFYNTGTYKEVVPRERILSKMSFADETGKVIPGAEVRVPGAWPDEVTVVAEFKSLDGKTQVTIKETGIPLVMKVFAKFGWEQQFDKLAALLPTVP
jgi:uncharacterized protein YndB with AHSA1/START domain